MLAARVRHAGIGDPQGARALPAGACQAAMQIRAAQRDLPSCATCIEKRDLGETGLEPTTEQPLCQIRRCPALRRAHRVQGANLNAISHFAATGIRRSEARPAMWDTSAIGDHDDQTPLLLEKAQSSGNCARSEQCNLVARIAVLADKRVRRQLTRAMLAGMSLTM
jgi:hypothetical protein